MTNLQGMLQHRGSPAKAAAATITALAKHSTTQECSIIAASPAALCCLASLVRGEGGTAADALAALCNLVEQQQQQNEQQQEQQQGAGYYHAFHALVEELQEDGQAARAAADALCHIVNTGKSILIRSIEQSGAADSLVALLPSHKVAAPAAARALSALIEHRGSISSTISKYVTGAAVSGIVALLQDRQPGSRSRENSWLVALHALLAMCKHGGCHLVAETHGAISCLVSWLSWLSWLSISEQGSAAAAAAAAAAGALHLICLHPGGSSRVVSTQGAVKALLTLLQHSAGSSSSTGSRKCNPAAYPAACALLAVAEHHPENRAELHTSTGRLVKVIQAGAHGHMGTSRVSSMASTLHHLAAAWPALQLALDGWRQQQQQQQQQIQRAGSAGGSTGCSAKHQLEQPSKQQDRNKRQHTLSGPAPGAARLQQQQQQQQQPGQCRVLADMTNQKATPAAAVAAAGVDKPRLTNRLGEQQQVAKEGQLAVQQQQQQQGQPRSAAAAAAAALGPAALVVVKEELGAVPCQQQLVYWQLADKPFHAAELAQLVQDYLMPRRSQLGTQTCSRLRQQYPLLAPKLHGLYAGSVAELAPAFTCWSAAAAAVAAAVAKLAAAAAAYPVSVQLLRALRCLKLWEQRQATEPGMPTMLQRMAGLGAAAAGSDDDDDDDVQEVVDLTHDSDDEAELSEEEMAANEQMQAFLAGQCDVVLVREVQPAGRPGKHAVQHQPGCSDRLSEVVRFVFDSAEQQPLLC